MFKIIIVFQNSFVYRLALVRKECWYFFAFGSRISPKSKGCDSTHSSNHAQSYSSPLILVKRAIFPSWYRARQCVRVSRITVKVERSTTRASNTTNLAITNHQSEEWLRLTRDQSLARVGAPRCLHPSLINGLIAATSNQLTLIFHPVWTY